MIPTFTLDEQRLFQLLIREYLFVSLYRAFAESLASENASRLASMQVAEKNIEERLRVLNTESRQAPAGNHHFRTAGYHRVVRSASHQESKFRSQPPI